MVKHQYFGKKGEDLAAEWLTGKGYEILDRNWRHGRYEVDIVARYQDVYHFIEVKTGNENEFGHPEERVSKNKIRNMMQGGVAWLYEHPGPKRPQYDVLAITFRKDAEPEYMLFADVYV
ncbi:MAG TPA: YraN family protein [Puia sp.]|jgi:putative endonuclease|nr:YraN family protein [Puia sp.]